MKYPDTFDKHMLNLYQHKLEGYFDDIIKNIGLALEKMWGNAAYQTTSELTEKICRDKSTTSMLITLKESLEKHFRLDKNLMKTTGQKPLLIFDVAREIEVIDEYRSLKERIITGKIPTSGLISPPGNCYLAKKQKDFVLSHETCPPFDNHGNPNYYTEELNLYSLSFPLYRRRDSKQNQNERREVLAVIQCNRINRAFSSSDENTIREMLDDFMPYYTNRLAEEDRARSIKFTRHELAHPIGALAKLTDVIKRNMVFKDDSVKRHAYHVEWETYINLLDGITKSLFFVTDEDQMIEKGMVCGFHNEILMPVVNQGVHLIDKNLQEGTVEKLKELHAIRIFYSGRDSRDPNSIPRIKLHVSKSRIFLAFFNLLSNSLKYSMKLPIPDLRKQYAPDNLRIDNRERRMQIDIFVDIIPENAKEFPGGLQIRFCDYGPGIDPRLGELIFEEGVRESRWSTSISGEGIGLWVVRRIVRDHGGEISLMQNELPTTFCIRFPKSIFHH